MKTKAHEVSELVSSTEVAWEVKAEKACEEEEGESFSTSDTGIRSKWNPKGEMMTWNFVGYIYSIKDLISHKLPFCDIMRIIKTEI